MKRLLRSARGVSLAEIMVAVAIVGIVASVGGRLMVSMTRYFQMNRARQEVQRDARTLFGLIGRDLRQAKASSVVIDQESGQPPYSRITFTKSNGRAVRCFQRGRKAYWVDVSTRAVSDNLRYLAFSHRRTEDDDIISIAVTMEKATYQGGTKALQLAIDKVRIMNE
ncbi:MAG: PulJ/GspJ family protein [Elusimicrobiota bacterium]